MLSPSAIFGQNPKVGCQEGNDVPTPKRSKKPRCDSTPETASTHTSCAYAPTPDRETKESLVGSPQRVTAPLALLQAYGVSNLM